MRISDWSSDVCSSDLASRRQTRHATRRRGHARRGSAFQPAATDRSASAGNPGRVPQLARRRRRGMTKARPGSRPLAPAIAPARSEEHTSELQSLMRNSYAVFCLKKKIKYQTYKILKYL